MPHGFLVRTAMGQCVVHIGHRNNPSTQWDRDPGQPKRIAASVPIFVVAQRDAAGHIQEILLRPLLPHGVQNVKANHRVPSHLHPLFISETARFEQDRVGG